MENLEPYLSKFSESGKRILNFALDESRRRNQHFVLPEHILYALILNETELFTTKMQELSVDANFIRLEVEKLLNHSHEHHAQGFRIAPETTQMFKYSIDRARSQNRRIIEASDILREFITNPESLLNNILQDSVLTKELLTFHGQVRKIDLDAKQFELRHTERRESTGISCRYKDYSDKEAAGWLNKFVIVTGFIKLSSDKNIRSMQVETVEINK